MIQRTHVTFNLSPLQGYIAGAMMGTDRGLRVAFMQWARIYSRFIRKRYHTLAHGGSDTEGRRWQDLAPSTKAARRKGDRKGKQDAILMNDGILYNALVVGAPGNHLRILKNGCEFGFGGGARHPGGKATIADIARFHDEGHPEVNLPQRQIIVEPDDTTVRKMGAAIMAAIARWK